MISVFRFVATSLFLLACIETSWGQLPLECNQTEDSISVLVDGRPVLKYNIAIQEPPEGMDAVYRRSGYIHPVYSPSGKVVTGDFAPDHAHQHALFCAFVNTSFEGKRVDFWNLHRETGRVRHDKVVSVHCEETQAMFVVELVHEALNEEMKPTPVLRETWTVTVYPVADPRFKFDIKSEIKLIADPPLIIKQYKYGGMAFRGSNEWIDQGTDQTLNAFSKAKRIDASTEYPPLAETKHQFLTSDGLRRIEGNHSHPESVSLFGIVDGGEVAGITVSAAPSNYRFPQAVRLHPSKPYFCFAPMVDGEFSFDNETKYINTYRYSVFDGLPND